MHFHKNLIVICFFLVLKLALAFRTCNSIRECEACVTSSSWRSNCRWCPVDNSCRATGSLFTPCSIDDNYHHTSECSNTFQTYDPDTAWKAALFSAVAYSPDANLYLTSAFPGESFSDVTQVQEGRYSGYTATWNSKSLIVVAIRGTDGGVSQLLDQAVAVLFKVSKSFEAGGTVQDYFDEGFKALWNNQRLQDAVASAVRKHPGAQMLITGHSLGGAIASIIGTYVAYSGLVPKENVKMYTFGMPRVGNYEYARAHDRYVKHSFRITQSGDPVPHLPTCIQGGCTLFFGPYHHGKEVYYSERSTSTNYQHGWKTCQGLPFNEDITCANSVTNWAICLTGVATPSCIDDHKIYFGIAIGDWWKSQRNNL